ncbi:MAG TPA: aminotransferase class I/II-fold pyridoxal phosphate-dependent enzyme [Amycolatopsis sp.]|nr:aminotransferase class I/II-fold pyridoxal phosphate-dependent enzyme [Amycolatopsis sp.]
MDLVRIEGRTSREVVDSIERAVHAGMMAPGDVVPSVRSLASQLKISSATVAAAYRELRNRGVLIGSVGKDTRISMRPPLASRLGDALPEGVRDLSDGNPDPRLLPSLHDAAQACRFEQFRYGDATLLPGMAQLATRQFPEFDLREDQVCLASGAMDGVERVLTAWLKPGDVVCVEDPCYTGVLDLIRALGLRPLPVAVDERGPLPDSLGKALRTRVDACIFTPRAHNPTSAAVDAERAAGLGNVLKHHPEVPVVENDHAGPVAGHSYHGLVPGRRNWVAIRSVSKSLGPDLRLSFLAGDVMTISRVEGRQRLGAGWVSHILQGLVLHLLSDAGVRRLVAKADRTYTRRRKDFVAELAARSVQAVGRSGLNVMVPVPEESSTLRLLQDRGWLVRAGESHRLHSPPFVRVTISSLDAEDAAELAADFETALHPGRRSHLA